MMTVGILCGLAAALLNSVAFLFSAGFLLRYRSPVRLFAFAHLTMGIIALPLLLFLFPWGNVSSLRTILFAMICWICVFLVGQCSFYAALRFFESSRASSLLGLKIIVLACIFMFVQHQSLCRMQWIAVFMAAAAACTFNWSGAGKTDPRGWIFILSTIVCYSMADLNETKVMLTLVHSGNSYLRSALGTTALLYAGMAVAALPFLAFLRPSLKQFKTAFPYASIYLLSQFFLFICFSLVLPVFGNVILATRGIFSVLIGAVLPFFGLAKFDSRIPARLWVRRGIAACLMTAAIILYSLATR